MSKILKAIYGSADKPLVVNGIDIPCYVLEDGRRVIVQSGLLKALGMSTGGAKKAGSRKIDEFIASSAIKDFISSSLGGRAIELIKFKTQGGDPQYNIITNNYEATAAAAVFNETTLTLGALSPEKNAGTPGYLQTLYDYHGLPWNTLTPSIGAVQ